jgi:hypothetical protein
MNDNGMKTSALYLASIIIFMTLGFSTKEVHAQSLAFSYKGDWSSWIPICNPNSFGDARSWGGTALKIFRYTDMSGIILQSEGGKTIFSFRIANFRLPDKKERKAHEKSGRWFSFSGTVEYYVNDEYPTAEVCAKDNCLVIPNAREDKTPSIKRQTSCEISIAPFKKDPQIWNIFFDGVGIGVSTRGLEFK